MGILPSNITKAQTKYPCPSHWYGPGHYFVEHLADAANDDRWKGRKASDVEITMTSPKEWNSKGSKSPAAERRCIVCKRPLPTDAKAGALTHKGTCQREHQNAQSRQSAKARRVPKVYPEATCSSCGKMFAPYRATQRFCSDQACKLERDRRHRLRWVAAQKEVTS